MSMRLPEYIDPIRLAEQNRLLGGKIALAKMKRLSSSLSDSKGEVEVDLQFSIDDAGQANIAGQLTTEFHLQCQRCTHAMVHSVNNTVSLAMVHSEAQAEKLPDRYEPLLLDDSIDGDDLSLTELIEDELILALPAIAMHDVSECPAGDKFRTTELKAKANDMANEQEKVQEKISPFAVLEQLKGKRD